MDLNKRIFTTRLLGGDDFTENLLRDVRNELFSVIVGIPKAIKNDLLFPHRRISTEEKLRSEGKRQQSMNIHQQDMLQYHAGKIQDLERENRDLKDLLVQRDKEIQVLNNKIRSMELQAP